MSVTATAPDQTSLEKRGPDGAPERAGRLKALLTHPLGRKLVPLTVLAAVLVPIAAGLWGSGAWPGALTHDVKEPLDSLNQWIIDNRDTHPLFLYFLLHFSNTATDAINAVYNVLDALGWIGVTATAVLFAWRAGGLGRAGLKVAGITLGAFVVCGLLGMWDPTMITLALMVVAVAVSAVIGALLGLAAGLSERFNRMLRPVLDTMQVMPAFSYLLPMALIFGPGTPAALFSTIIYAVPPMTRLTALGLRGADPAVLEASSSLGASFWQRLRTARVPLARKQMLLGLNQTIMMALSMVVIASIVGAGGLGEEVFTALSTTDVGKALAAGLPIVLIAVWLDRTTGAAGERFGATSAAEATGARRLLHGWRAWTLVTAGAVVATVAGRLAGATLWPEAWVYEVSTPVNKVQEWITDNLYQDVPVLGGTKVWADHITEWMLNPLRDGLLNAPWWLLLLLVAVLALLVGTWGTALTAVLSMSAVGVLGVWPKTLDTLSQVLVGLALTLVLGFAIGVLAARVGWVERRLRLVLDVLQTLPQFVYLIPVVALMGVGRVAAITAAVAYALPAVVRITTQGIKEVDPAALEAARSMGASGAQQLRQVQLPLARPALLVAVNQGVVLVLAVVVVGGLVGGGALGYDVVFGLARGELGVGLVAGTAIVCLGLVLDRVTQPTAATRKEG
ncbi:ABC transporter permease subunit [Streptomyces sp. NA02950]|uniref:ABC transporter permease subunit n=1 Tax=Streptomyces sp. NA02950 TaxID=2742137 RepID=UPI0015900651|nr:ABC transporter permease subunit [Streptomyces sp. NA02950]QKV94440.1 ABC transporter permease subunit [Streptomyces sp. NA02950]